MIKKYFYPQIISLFLLGFSSGFPLALVNTTLQAWFTDTRRGLLLIGFVTLLSLPYLFKFLWAPFLDRYCLPGIDRRRGWILLMQVLLLITLVLMGCYSPQENAPLLMVLAFAVAFFSATQDISLDAYRAEILKPEDRAMGVSVWIMGWRVAAYISGGLTFIIAHYLGWQITYILMGFCMSIGILATLLSPAPAVDHTPPTLRSAVLEPFKEFLQRPLALPILAFIFFYKFGDAYALSMSTTFYMKGVGLSNLEIGKIVKVASIFATFVGGLLGGLAVLRWRMYRALLIFGILQTLSAGLYVALAIVGKNMPLVIFTISAEYFTAAMSSCVFLAFIMGLCDQRFTATQFALLSAFSSIGRVLIGPFAAFIIECAGWVNFFILSIIFSLPGLFILWFLRDKLGFDNEKIGAI